MILSGKTVVEIADGVAGPLTALRLGDLGASVVKIESEEGDWTRQCPPYVGNEQPDGVAAIFFALNRGKRSVAIGRNRLGAEPFLRRLLSSADFCVVDRCSGLISSLDIDNLLTEVELSSEQLIVADISPFGRLGPLADHTGSELIAQAMAGYTRYLGAYDAPARRLGADIATIATATCAVQGVLAASLWKSASGRGQRIDLSLWNTLLTLKTINLAAQSWPDFFEVPRFAGANNPPQHGWRCADRPITFGFGGLKGSSSGGWVDFVREVGLEHLTHDRRFDERGLSSTGYGSRSYELRSEYEAEFFHHSAADVVEMIRRNRGAASIYQTYDELFDNEQVIVSNVDASVSVSEDEDARTLSFPASFTRSIPVLNGGIARIGEHSKEVAQELGYDDAEIGEFVRTHAIIAATGLARDARECVM